MSEYSPISPNKNDKNVLVPFSDGRIEVMQLSDNVDESGRRIAYKIGEDGKTAITKAGDLEAYSDDVQSYYANKLAMDRNPTAEQLERNSPEKVVSDLGGVALGATGITAGSIESVDSHEQTRELSAETGLNFQLVTDEVRTIKSAIENSRQLPEAEGRHTLNAYIIKKANAAYDELKAGNMSVESYSVVANTLLGAASSSMSIDMIFNMLRDSQTFDPAELAELSSQAGAITDISTKDEFEGERVKISYANSLIAKSEYILENNDNIADGHYRALVGFITGLSMQIKDPSTSNGFVSGALSQLRKYS